MSRRPLEVADRIRAAGTTFYPSSRKWFTWLHLKILTAIVCCRTSTLGGPLDECSRCGQRTISFHSCRNRHGPKCQSNARDRWLEARRRELLPVPYAHGVFTLPGQLAPLALQNKSAIYGRLFRTSAQTLLTVARDQRHLGAEIGFFSVLPTWNQKRQHHSHVHGVVPAGGWSPDPTRWVAARTGFFLPVLVLSRVFRGKFVEGWRELHAAGRLGFYGSLAGLATPAAFAAMRRGLFRSAWVVYAKRPFGGAEPALRYLGCYTGHLQSPSGGAARRGGRVPLARLGASEQEAPDAPGSRRVSAAVLSARLAARLRPHPAFRVLRSSAARGLVAALLSAPRAERPLIDLYRFHRDRRFTTTLALSTMRRLHGDCGTIHRR